MSRFSTFRQDVEQAEEDGYHFQPGNSVLLALADIGDAAERHVNGEILHKELQASLDAFVARYSE